MFQIVYKCLNTYKKLATTNKITCYIIIEFENIL
jgi:hypothetical protein